MTGYNDWPGLAKICLATGRLEEAREWLERSREEADLGDNSTRFLLNSTGLHLDAGRPREALAQAEEMLGLENSSWAAKWGSAQRVRALIQLDSLTVAREALEEFLATPDRFAALARLVPLTAEADLFLAEGHADSALARIDELAESSWLGAHQLRTRARALAALGRYSEAAAVLESALASNGYLSRLRYELGRVHEQAGRWDDAVRQYDLFLEAWSAADPGWQEVADARRRLDRLKG